jgi:hypothetical protein
MHNAQKPQGWIRWRKAAWGLLLFPVALSNGCSSMNNTEAGALGGGVAGGVVGTLIGAATGHPGAGAAIGAASGAAIGGLSGAAEDHREKRAVQNVQAAVARGQAELTEIAKMALNNVPDAVIIDHVRQSGAIFALTSEQIIWLQQNRVSPLVIQEMQATNYGYRGYYVPQPAVVVEQPPPVGVGVGVVIHR